MIYIFFRIFDPIEKRPGNINHSKAAVGPFESGEKNLCIKDAPGSHNLFALHYSRCIIWIVDWKRYPVDGYPSHYYYYYYGHRLISWSNASARCAALSDDRNLRRCHAINVRWLPHKPIRTTTDRRLSQSTGRLYDL